MIVKPSVQHDLEEDLYEILSCKGSVGRFKRFFRSFKAYLLRRVSFVFHYIILPNASTAGDVKECYDYINSLKTRGQIWSYIAGKEEMYNKIWQSARNRDLESFLRQEQSGAPNSLPYLRILMIIFKLGNIWGLEEDSYENILHFVVQNDFIALTAVICKSEVYSKAHQINQGNKMENTPLHLACKEMNLRHALLLIDTPNINLSLQNREGRTCLHVLLATKSLHQKQAKAVFYAQDCITVVQKMLERCPHLPTVLDGTGTSSLDMGIDIGEGLLVEIMLLSVLKCISWGKAHMEYSRYLRLAVVSNIASIVHLFARRLPNDFEAVLSCCSPIEQFLADIVSMAVELHKMKSLHTLLSMPIFRKEINRCDSRGQTPLHRAISLGRSRDSLLLNLLLCNGAKPLMPYETWVHSIDNALSYAAAAGDATAVRILLTCCDRSHLTIGSQVVTLPPDDKKLNGRRLPGYFADSNYLHSNPIVSAVLGQSVETLPLLLQYVGSRKSSSFLIDFQDSTGHSPLSAACSSHCLEAVAQLLAAGSNPAQQLDTLAMRSNCGGDFSLALDSKYS